MLYKSWGVLSKQCFVISGTYDVPLQRRSSQPNMYIQSVLVLPTVLSSTVQSYKLGDMKPAFVTPVIPSAGNCSLQDTEKLRVSFCEAVEAVQKAISAIENLKKSAPSAIVHPDRRRTWKRQAQLLKALFNIDVDKSGPLGKSNGDVKVVKGKRTSAM